MRPFFVILPVPESLVVPQQNIYAPVWELNRRTDAGFVSSCRQESNIWTANVQVAVLPATSVAVQVTEVVPTGRQEPDGGTQATVTPGQLSLPVGVANVTTLHGPLAIAKTLVGHVIVGGCVSFTVTVNVHEPPVAEHETVVVPTGKNDPEAGEQVTVPQPSLVGGG
jgi:hypothetical protein